MKKPSYLALQLAFLTATSSLFLGCGCEHHEKKTDTDAGDAGAAGASTRQDARTGSSDDGDTTSDTGSPRDHYLCGGDNAECDLLNANSCDEGTGCRYFVAETGTGESYARCVAVGEGNVGEACDDSSSCAAGLVCSDGSCKKYCCDLGSSNECTDKQACIIEVLNQDDEISGVRLCDRCDECNPLTAQGCARGLGCYPIKSPDTDIGCRLCLESDGRKKPGEACDFPNQCEPGSGCYRINEAKPTCASFCDLGASSDPCAPEGVCKENLIGKASMNNTVGLCAPVK
jgi:hypothetical protein